MKISLIFILTISFFTTTSTFNIFFSSYFVSFQSSLFFSVNHIPSNNFSPICHLTVSHLTISLQSVISPLIILPFLSNSSSHRFSPIRHLTTYHFTISLQFVISPFLSNPSSHHFSPIRHLTISLQFVISPLIIPSWVDHLLPCHCYVHTIPDLHTAVGHDNFAGQ